MAGKAEELAGTATEHVASRNAGTPAVGGKGLALAAIRAEESARPDHLFADPLAAAFVAAARWSPPAGPADRRVAALRIWVVARTVFLDELLASACRDGCGQVVLLGAGLDARAFRLPWPPGIRCFELDTADVLDRKGQVLSAQAAVAGCERIAVAGDLQADWPAALLAAGMRPEEPTAWIAEGLLAYLTQEDADAVVADLTALAAPGSWLGLTVPGRRPSAGGSRGRASRASARRRSSPPADPLRWLAGHGWAAQLTDAAEVLAAHGRQVPAAPGQPAPPAEQQPGSPESRRPPALLVTARRIGRPPAGQS
jgi:methyltransferase (TIGR00027 family)